MRWTGWARIDFFGDELLGSQYVPLARLLIGQVINTLRLRAAGVNESRRLAYANTDTYVADVGLGVGSIRQQVADNVLIEAGYAAGIPWARITAGSSSSSNPLEGYGFILSPFNGSEPPPPTSTPFYDSTLLLINGGAYAHDYPDADHHWFTAANNGNYTGLGNEFLGNPLLQGNLHWRSTVDPSFHVSWLGNPSDPIPYFDYSFQNGYASGNSPYQVRLAPATVHIPATGQIFNYDAEQVFSSWLMSIFGRSAGSESQTSSHGEPILYKGHVVKSVYSLLLNSGTTSYRVIGAGGSVDSQTKKRALYFVARSIADESATTGHYAVAESIYSLDIDDVTATPILIGSRSIATSGTYNTPVSVDPIPLHSYQWDETALQFRCVAMQVNTIPYADSSFEPVLHVHNVTTRVGRMTWTLSGGSASWDFSASQLVSSPSFVSSLTLSDPFSYVTTSAGTLTVYQTSDFEKSFSYSITNGLIGVTPLNDVTTSLSLNASSSTNAHNSNYSLDTVDGTGTAPLTSVTDEKISAIFTQSLTCGSKSWDVVTYSRTDDLPSSSNVDDSHATTKTADATQNFSYTGKSFLFFDDVNKIFAYLEFELSWTRTLESETLFPAFGPPVVITDNDTTSIGTYQGRYVVESPLGTQATDWFDLTSSGTASNAPGASNLFSFMPQLPINVTVGSSDSYDAIQTSPVDDPTFVQFKRDFGSSLPLFELANIINFSLWNMPSWSASASFHTGVSGRTFTGSETDGSYGFATQHPGGWALNGKRLCFSQIGPHVVDALGNTVTQSPFQFLTQGNLDTLAGATGDERGYYPLCYIAPKEIKAQGQS